MLLKEFERKASEAKSLKRKALVGIAELINILAHIEPGYTTECDEKYLRVHSESLAQKLAELEQRLQELRTAKVEGL